ncbi:MAG: hypothetical protein ACI9JN_001252 [Bacteroidia bacterium]|jgi:hypothetical protein
MKDSKNHRKPLFGKFNSTVFKLSCMLVGAFMILSYYFTWSKDDHTLGDNMVLNAMVDFFDFLHYPFETVVRGKYVESEFGSIPPDQQYFRQKLAG